MNLFSELNNINELIPTDFGGGSSLNKTYLMSYIILRNDLKKFVEIGVYRGKSLFPAAYAVKQNKGMSYGIDPYLKDAAREYDVEKDLQTQIDEFIDDADFESIYQNVLKLKSELGLENHLELIRKTSSDSSDFFRKNNIKIDMLHIDGNHDTKYVMEDVELYSPLLKPDSIVVMDDIDWDSVKPAYEKLKETATVLFESTTFAVLINSKIQENMLKKYEFELSNIFDVIENFIEQKVLIDTKNFTINNLESNIDLINNELSRVNGKLLMKNNELLNLESNILRKNEELTNLKLNNNLINGELSRKNKELVSLESNLKALANSRKSDLSKNFQILFNEYLSNKPTPKKRMWARISAFPYLYHILKSKGNIKSTWMNIKGYRAIKHLDLFDEHYYLTTYKNILISGMNPLIHYMYYGYKENKRPYASFDGRYYLNRYKSVKKSKMNPLVHYSLYGINEGKKTNNIKISVIVTSYNHEKYIKECIDSILMQKDVDFELIVGDDSSQDDTRKILEDYQTKHPKIIKLLPLSKNMGITKNLQRCLKAARGKYIAICEGDDYWTDHYKLKKQVNFLEERKECSMCFNSFSVFYEDKERSNHIFQDKLTKKIYTTRELIKDNFIGNFSCCMYRMDVVKKFPDKLYDFFTVDWIFNIVCSEYGKIGFLNEPMSVYRVHNSGFWSSKDDQSQYSELIELIDTYNEFLSFRYDREFKECQMKIIKLKNKSISKKSDFQDLIILDDVFPHPLSAFRLQEYNSYLEYFKKTKIYCNSLSFPALNEKKSIETIIKDYEKQYPQFKGKVERFNPNIFLQASGIYSIFLSNIYFYIDTIEKYKIPFVFTLYPGGGFELNNKASDGKLRRIFSSPFFKRVIVTQKIVHDYLIDNNFCKSEQIEEVFGVVTPLNLLEKEYDNKKYFGIDKPYLNVCFVAHRYTKDGVDKGYDVFIDVAHELAKKYDNIYFHVVGNFDEKVLDITSIKNRICFHGPQLSEWFNDFYRDIDIIISPNIPYKLSNGSFDGFPTGCCTEAGLHKVAIFCTDELKLNTGKYKDGKEIVIIPHNTQKIVEIIEKYYHNPEELQKIAEEGYLKIKELYNYENQIAPRIKILEKLIKGY